MKVLGLVALSAAAAAIAAATGTAGAEELIVNSYGGPYEAIIRERIIEPFEKTTDITVIYDASGSASQDYAKIKATGGQPGFDVNVMTATQSLDGCREGLLEKLTTASVPNLARLDPTVSAMAGPCGAVHEVQYMALLWRTDKVDPAPRSWNALYAPALKGRIMLPSFGNIMSVSLMQVLSVMNGGTLDSIDPGFAAMVKLAPQTVGFEQSSAIMGRYVRDGQVWAMPFWSGRSQLLKDEGLPVDYAIPEEGTVPLIATLNVPVGAEHKDAAFRFVDFFLGKAGQEAWVEGYSVGSIRDDIEVPAEVRARQITTKADIEKLLLPDLQNIADNLSAWGRRWDREVVPAAN